jgi:hypothetical protein
MKDEIKIELALVYRPRRLNAIGGEAVSNMCATQIKRIRRPKRCPIP